jgi:hypothetical protein
LQEQHLGGGDGSLGSAHVGGREAHVGPWGDDDAVLPGIVHHDESHASGSLRILNDEGVIHTGARQMPPAMM